LNDHYELAEAIVVVGALLILLGYLLDVFSSDRQRHFKVLLMSTAAAAFSVVRQEPPSCPLLDAHSSPKPTRFRLVRIHSLNRLERPRAAVGALECNL
jgi:hypothetical protein